MKTQRKISRWTKLIQPGTTDHAFSSLVDPITRGSTVVFDDVRAFRQRSWRDKSKYSYGLQGTPVTRRLERQIAMLDDVAHALLYPSGLNAICMTLMALVKAGERFLIPWNCYAPTMEMARLMANRLNIELHTYSPEDLTTLTFTANTRLVWVETPGSVTMEVADLPAIAALAHANDALVVADATWSASISLPAFELGADVVIYALTKYQSGGSDVLMGSVTTDSDEIHDMLHETRTVFGIGVSPEDCYLILRNLAHMKLRYLAQDQSARALASWFEQQPFVNRVLHPAFKSCPGHEIWKRDFSAAASLFSVVFNDTVSQPQLDTCIDALRLFRIGVSWGGAVSLAVPFERSQLSPRYPYHGCLVRFYIGLEDVDDLIDDLAQAFSTIKSV